MRDLIDIFFVVLIIGAVIKGWNYDSTDNAAAKERSGMGILVDHKTGIQYVTTGFYGFLGGITPRLKKDGTPMTVEDDQ